MKNKRFSFNWFLENNKVMIVVSIFISLVIWLYMSAGASNDTTLTITNIPIQIELSEEAKTNGLNVFSSGDLTASVTVTGNRAVLGQIGAGDVNVTAVATTVNTPGEYQLNVNATKKNMYREFQILSSATPSTIKITADYIKESSFQIQDNVVFKVADGYYASTALSAQTVNISGPQTKVLQIEKVAAVDAVSGTISSNTSSTVDLILYDKSGREINQSMLTMDIKSVEAQITVLPEKTFELQPVFVNKPSNLTISSGLLDINPKTIVLAGPKDVLDATDYLKLETVDFSNILNEKNEFELAIDIPKDCICISNATTAKLTLDFSSYGSKTVKVTNFSVKGLDENKYSSNVTQSSLPVTVIGPRAQLEKLKDNSITGVIDTSAFNGTLGSVQMPLTFSINGVDSCWVYGSYKANLTITDKNS